MFLIIGHDSLGGLPVALYPTQQVASQFLEQQGFRYIGPLSEEALIYRKGTRDFAHLVRMRRTPTGWRMPPDYELVRS